jgi:hypothetical protein
MGNRSEGGVAIFDPRVGGGKTAFAQMVAGELQRRDVDVKVFPFSKGNVVTRAVRLPLNAWYSKSGTPGALEKRFHSDEIRSADGIALRLLNREALHKARREGREIVSVSAIAGRGAPHRSSVMGDVPPEVSAADANTTAYVTLPEAETTLREKGSLSEVKVTGFLVPHILRENDQTRRNERLSKFEKGEPTADDPLRLTFMTTGQYQHIDYLKEHVLEDPLIQQWIKEGKVKMTIYMWKSKVKAYGVYKKAKELGLDTVLTSKYDPESEAGVQVFSRHDPVTATETSFQIANDADILLSVMGERVGWTRYVPTIALDPGEVNKNMIENTQWAQEVGLVGPQSELDNLGKIISDQLEDPHSRLRNYYTFGEAVTKAVAGQVHDNSFDVFNGAGNIADALLLTKTG